MYVHVYSSLSRHYCSFIQTDPKRVKKVLPKILKTLKPENRVKIIGVTSAPFSKCTCIYVLQCTYLYIHVYMYVVHCDIRMYIYLYKGVLI